MVKIAKLFFLLISLIQLTFIKVNGQIVNLSLGTITENNVNPNYLWQSILNTNQLPVTVQMSLIITSNSKGVVYSAHTDKLELNNVTTIIGYNNIKIIRNDYPNQEAKSFLEKTGMLPSGVYTYCINVINFQNKEILANECQNVISLVNSPLLLSSPENKSSINSLYPHFVWLPLYMPVSDRLTQYELKVYEMLRDQTSTDALVRNRPIMQKTRLSTNQLLYSNDIYPLSYGKTYAWQVTAVDNLNNILGKSEVWEFTPTIDTVPTITNNFFQSYIDLNANTTQSEYHIKSTIKIKYTGRKFPSELSYLIYDEYGKLVEKSTTHLKVLSRENWLEINLEEFNKLKNRNKYSIEFINSINQSFTINFIYFQ